MLAEKLQGIIDGYYENSDDYRLLKEVLEEVDFLYSRGILAERKLGRFVDIIKNGGKPNG